MNVAGGSVAWSMPWLERGRSKNNVLLNVRCFGGLGDTRTRETLECAPKRHLRDCQTRGLLHGRKSGVSPPLASIGNLLQHSVKCENEIVSSERCERDICHHALCGRPRKLPKPVR